MFKRIALPLVGILLGSLAFSGAQAGQGDWPQKPIHLIVPYSPGGNVDLIGRTLSEPLSKELGQPVVVENRAGAGGTIGSGEVSRANADGYTLLLGDIATHGINPHVYDDLAYDPVADFTPIVQITSVPLVLGVGPRLDVSTFEEFRELAESRPEDIDYASAGIGTPQHLSFEYLESLLGFEGLHIPYQGSSPARTALIGGEVGAFIDGTMVPAVREGSIKALAVTSAERAQALPDVPTLSELGVDMVFTSWHGLFAPADIDPAIAERLNEAMNKVLDEPAVRQRLEAVSIEVIGGTADEFATFVDTQSETLGELVEMADVSTH
ncbi:Bug family tripartite tricarboxylate transporter substrate binding protein [Kushneria indalinina]|uniref:Tripartite-type tricarboxylate transporter receptor subunit TctC n=1 Tax=Kushneria indalinina DSM 14324 TaxID=1122140 RepID=A0A3D9DUE3_9GAMM|nr:tripartite tricarboxylate transporter substrate binding protein [Kushneria indalinina]REC94376.1 tripartite-type tricarboxylate transporter receptor subunit TctC [Kushneria indalinina DSM 14324]